MAQNNNKFAGVNIGLNSVTANKIPIAETDFNNNTVQFVVAMLTLYTYLGGMNPTTGLGLLAGGDFKNRGLKSENLALTQSTLSLANQATPITITQTVGAFNNIGGTLTFLINNPNKLATVISYSPEITNNFFNFRAETGFPNAIQNITLSSYWKSPPTTTNPTPTRTLIRSQTLDFLGTKSSKIGEYFTLPKQTLKLNNQNLTAFVIDVDVLLTNYTKNSNYAMTVSIPKDQVLIEYYNEII
jgi:hypothetical protein